ncbi:MAG: hypothetical protein PHG06_10980 [Parabacteroides sp.]|nr:hypothetical protein [Parabacteroides sp.]
MTVCDGRVDVYDSGCGVQNTVTIDTDRHQCDIEMSQIKFRRGAGSPFQRAALAPRRAQNLLAGCIFDGLACQKCFCVTLDKSNRTRLTPEKG